MTASVGRRLVDGDCEQKEGRIHGHQQQCGECRGKSSRRGLNCNGKKYNKDQIKKEEEEEKILII